MNDKVKRTTDELLHKSLLREIHEGFNVNPPGNRNALPLTTPKAPPTAPDKPKNS